MKTYGRACRDASDLLHVASQEGVTGAWKRRQSDFAADWLSVEEAKLFVPHPAIFQVLRLVLACQHHSKVSEVDATGRRWDDSAHIVAGVAGRVLLVEDLREAVVALLWIDRVAVTMLI